MIERIVSTSSGTWARTSLACEIERVGGTDVGVGVGVGPAVGVAGAGVARSTVPTRWASEGAWLNETAVGDGVAVGGGVDVLVGVGVGDGLPPHPPSASDKSSSVHDRNVNKKADSALRDARRATGVRSINLFLLLAQDDGSVLGMLAAGSTASHCRRGRIPQNGRFVKQHCKKLSDTRRVLLVANLIGFDRGHVVYWQSN